MKRRNKIAVTGAVGLLAFGFFAAWLYAPIAQQAAPVTPQERDAIALDVYESVIHHSFDPVAHLDRIVHKFALSVDGESPPEELLARFSPQHQAYSTNDPRAGSLLTYEIRNFALVNRDTANVEVTDWGAWYGCNVTQYEVSMVDGKWRVRVTRCACGSG